MVDKTYAIDASFGCAFGPIVEKEGVLCMDKKHAALPDRGSAWPERCTGPHGTEITGRRKSPAGSGCCNPVSE